MHLNPKFIGTEQNVPEESNTESLNGDEIVISGVAGIFPKSANTLELMENLYNKVNMVSEIKYPHIDHPGLPNHLGRIAGLEKFDSQFFRVTHWQSSSMDPQTRKIMEIAYGAMYDAGVNPVTLAGTKLGIYVGSSYADIFTMKMFNSNNQNNFVISGCSKSMQANRISYWIDSKGPSLTVDMACASSMVCLEQAYMSLNRGECDSAIVGGCNCCIHPNLSFNLRNAGHLCLDGKTKCFDKNGDGYVRSEAVNVLFLQKAKDAKRIYAKICHIKGKFFARPDANFLPIYKSEDLKEFLEEFYADVKISPSEVEYVEAFGSGIAEADSRELDAIGRFFAKSKSVKVGSIKSNIGNTEAASGLCSVTKLCLAYKKGQLPANLHYKKPQDRVSAIRNGRIQIVTENEPFSRGYTAINNFSFTGANFHALLRGWSKNKDVSQYKTRLPRLITISGRDENGVNKILDILASQPTDPEQIALLHNVYQHDIPGHTGRSYIILDTNERNETVCLNRNFNFYSGISRPVCFLYSGMGSAWPGMGTELLKIPIFEAAIERCRKFLEPEGIDVVKILTSPDGTMFNSILNTMVGITAMQIALTDVLKAIGIVPDYVIGHSIGELGCAYADGCFSAEETIMSSYLRGFVSIQTPFIRGMMAAVGLGYKDVFPLCPPEIDVACHNNSELSTISGPADVMTDFMAELKAKGIFIKEIACGNIAYHSRYINVAGPELYSAMHSFIKEPRLRSDKWISTSVPQDEWDQPHAKYASAEYFANNLLSPVYFEENATMIPADALIIEIAPHNLLRGMMNKSHEESIHISLTKRGNPQPVTFLLEAIGQLYLTGLNPQVDVLYPKVEFPVSTETPLLSHLVSWEHSVNWSALAYTTKRMIQCAARNVAIYIHDDEHKYIGGHIINGINEFPEGALLVLVWETLAMYKGKQYSDMSLIFKDVTFHNHLTIETDDILRLEVMIQKGSQQFEITNGDILVVTGHIKTDEVNIEPKVYYTKDDENETYFNEEDIYTALCTRGYNYEGEFRSIHSINKKQNKAYVKWTKEWSTFLDSLIQFNAFAKKHDGVSRPKIIETLRINVDIHKIKAKVNTDGIRCHKAEIFKFKELTRSGGVELSGLILENELRVAQYPDVLATRVFVPYIMKENIDIDSALIIMLQMVADNKFTNSIKIAEIKSSSKTLLEHTILKVCEKIMTTKFDIDFINTEWINEINIENYNLILVKNCEGNHKTITNLFKSIEEDTFVITLGPNRNIAIDNEYIRVLSTMPVGEKTLILLRKENRVCEENITYIPIYYDNTLTWWPRVQSELQKSRRVVLVSEKQYHCRLFGIIKKLKKENNSKIGCLIINDFQLSRFDPKSDIYKKQMQARVTYNILDKEQFGSYYYIPASKSSASTNLSLTSKTFKDLDNFTWIESPQAASHAISVQVTYAGLSSRDSQKAMGQIKDGNLLLGFDFSGIDNMGQRVMGLINAGAVSSTVEADPMLLWPVPDFWSMEDAATVPLPYVHAYYCLAIRNQLYGHHTVLITGGAGGLGQAVISICLNLGCKVFTTVSNLDKKKFLLRLFPKLKEENIFYSSNEYFFAEVKYMTNNERCHYVINCGSDRLREAAAKCVGFLGSFLDLSVIDMPSNTTLGMSYFEEDRSYKFINLSNLFKPEHFNEKVILQKMIAEGIMKGIVRPLSRMVYSCHEVPRAFRLLSIRNNRGRVLVNMEEFETANNSNLVIPRMSYSEGVHIIVCDKMNLSVELIDHLIRNGAKYIIAHLDSAYNASYLNLKSASWKKFDVTIRIISGNLQKEKDCKRLLKVGLKFGSVTGIFLVQDFGNEVTEPKEVTISFNQSALIARNLDVLTRKICCNLRHFVLISISEKNISSQYAISECDNLFLCRNECGLPALILRADLHTTLEENLLLTLKLLKLSTLFNCMDISLKLNYNNVLTFNLEKQPTIDLDQKLCEIIGNQNINDIDESRTLNELIIKDINWAEIKILLKKTNLSTEVLKEMTIARLRSLGRNIETQQHTSKNVGLAALFNYIERDENVATETLILMDTQITAIEGSQYMNRSEAYLLMIPGFEGHHRIFTSIAKILKIKAMTLQLEPDLKCESIPIMAEILKNRIKSNFKISKKFHLLGYSFGVNVALETARLLEADGLKGVVFCLDSSPEALKVQINSYIKYSDAAELQNAVIQHIYTLMTGQVSEVLKQDLINVYDWPNKIDICVKQLKKQVSLSIEYQKDILNSVYQSIVVAQEYEPTFKLESELILVKAIPHTGAVGQLSDDYDLSKYTKQPVKVFNINSDHTTLPYNYQVSNIINKSLDSEVLEEIKHKNRCEVYFM